MAEQDQHPWRAGIRKAVFLYLLLFVGYAVVLIGDSIVNEFKWDNLFEALGWSVALWAFLGIPIIFAARLFYSEKPIRFWLVPGVVFGLWCFGPLAYCIVGSCGMVSVLSFMAPAFMGFLSVAAILLFMLPDYLRRRKNT